MSSDWPTFLLSDLIAVKHGFAFKGEYFTDEATEYQLTTPGNFAINGGFQVGKGKYYTGPIPEDYILRKGDLIVTMTDLSKAADTLGYAAVIPDTKGTTWLHNQRVGLVQIKSQTKVLPEFLHFLMRSESYRHWVVASASGSTVKHTSPGRICEFQFNLPSVSEQAQIGSILTALDDRIALLRETNTTLEAIAQALFKSWFVDFDPVRAKQESREPEGMDADTAALFPDSFEESELGLVPKGWIVSTIDQSTSLIIDYRGKTPKKLGRNWSILGIPAVSAKNIKNGRLVQKQAMNFVDSALFDIWMKDKLMPGDILMTSEAPLGELLYLAENHNYCLSQRIFALRANPIHCFSSFLYFWLSSTTTQERLSSRATGTTVVGIRQSELRKVQVLLPPTSIQEKAHETLSSCLLKIEKNEAVNETLTTLRDTLLPRLISGQLRLPDAEALIEDAAGIITPTSLQHGVYEKTESSYDSLQQL